MGERVCARTVSSEVCSLPFCRGLCLRTAFFQDHLRRCCPDSRPPECSHCQNAIMGADAPGRFHFDMQREQRAHQARSWSVAPRIAVAGRGLHEVRPHLATDPAQASLCSSCRKQFSKITFTSAPADGPPRRRHGSRPHVIPVLAEDLADVHHHVEFDWRRRQSPVRPRLL